MGMDTPTKVTTRCTELKRKWLPRNTEFEAWYKILLLTDDLKQSDMESFVTNDPRTYYNLALHLLTPDVVPHKLKERGDRAGLAKYAAVNVFLGSCWERQDRTSRRRGRQSWLRNLVGTMLVTGWHSVFAIATEDATLAEVWNPAEVFPEFGDDELLECAHVYTVSSMDAKRKLLRHPDWKQNIRLPENLPVEIQDYWYFDGDSVNNVVTINNLIVKPDQPSPFTSIPILVSPIGGLPDRGVIMTGDDWRGQVGQSIFAANQRVYRDYNKQMSFLQQLLRDTAQVRLLEKSRERAIINPSDVFKRGAIFRMTPEESVERLDVGAVPMDVRSMLFDIQSMIQRGALPWALYGNIQQEIASYLMSQIASAAHQVLDDYRDGIRAVLEDVDRLWLTHISEQNLAPYGFSLPPDLPEELEVDVGLEISIPGDLIQRVSVARMANPSFTMSEHTILSLLFPEILNPLQEQAKARAELALTHPVAMQVSIIQAWRQESQMLRDGGQHATADLFERAASIMEQRLGEAEGPGAPPGPATSSSRPGGASPPPGEIIPRELMGMQSE